MFDLDDLLYFRIFPLTHSEYVIIKNVPIPAHVILYKRNRVKRSLITIIRKIKLSKVKKLWRKDILFELVEEFY